MLFLRSWLEEYIDLSEYSNEKLAEIITAKSSEIEEINTIRDYFEGKVLVGKIENTRSHPDADRLKIFDINLGEKGKVQIVSAAPNVRDGLIVPTAITGAKLPGLTIEPRKMRGEESQGMCCGQSELMLETGFSSGLWELDTDETNLGKSICEVYPDKFPEEVVFDIDIMPDRVGYIGSHLGFALEIAFCLEKPQLLKEKAQRITDPFFDFAGTLSETIKNNPSITINFEDKTDYANLFFLFELNLNPDQAENYQYYLPHQAIKKMYLTEANIIGGLTDLSNYLLKDVGQPNHFFSKNKLTNNESWKIDELKEQTPFKGLGQLKNANLPKGLKVIQNQNNEILAIPGITGGNSTKTEYNDSHVIFETASFPAENVARNSFAIHYRSDSSNQYAGEINPKRVLVLLLHLIETLSQSEANFSINSITNWFNKNFIKTCHSRKGGNPVKTPDTFQQKAEYLLNLETQPPIEPDFDYLAERMDGQGKAHWQPIFEEKLKLIGNYEAGKLSFNQFYSKQINQPELLNELSRLVGYDNLQPQDLVLNINNEQRKEFPAYRQLREVVNSFGFNEIITRPFVSVEKLTISLNEKAKNPEAKIDYNQIATNQLEILKSHNTIETFVRDSLLPSLLKSLSENIQQGEKEPKIFEINKIYTYQNKGLKEKRVLSGVVISEDPYLATSLINTVCEKIGGKPQAQPVNETSIFANLGQGHEYKVSSLSSPTQGEVPEGRRGLEGSTTNTLTATLLELSNFVKKEFGLPLNKKVWFFEIDLTNWDCEIQTYRKYQEESQYPSINRSYSLYIPKNLQWSEVEQKAKSTTLPETIVNISPTERIESNGKDVLNFEAEFISYERTLAKEEVANWENQLFSSLENVEVR